MALKWASSTCMFCFPNRGPKRKGPGNLTLKFERNSSLEYYHMNCIGKTKHTSERGLLLMHLIVVLTLVFRCERLLIRTNHGTCF